MGITESLVTRWWKCCVNTRTVSWLCWKPLCTIPYWIGDWWTVSNSDKIVTAREYLYKKSRSLKSSVFSNNLIKLLVCMWYFCVHTVLGILIWNYSSDQEIEIIFRWHQIWRRRKAAKSVLFVDKFALKHWNSNSCFPTPCFLAANTKGNKRSRTRTDSYSASQSVGEWKRW